MSFTNIILYSRTLMMEDEKEKGKEGKKGEEIINADDPHNKDLVRQVLYG